MSESPPSSPMKILKAQLLLKKVSKAKKKGTKSAPKSNPAPKEKTAAETTENGEDAGSDKENTDRAAVSWAKNPQYTSKLLSLIEESLRYRLSFGFKVPQDAKVSSSGMTTIKTAESIALALFPSSLLPLAKLGKAVTAHIRALKTDYGKYKAELGSTGHGLIVEDCSEEIQAGTTISNVWEKIQSHFLWYKRLHLLLSASPIYDGSGMANSATPLNTSVLGARQPSPEWDLDAIDHSFHAEPVDNTDNFSDTHETNTPSKTADADVFGSGTTLHVLNSSPTPTPAAPLVTSSPVSASTATFTSAPVNTRKRKDPFDDAKMLTENYLNVHIETEKIRAKSKCVCLELTSSKDLEIEHLKAVQQERQHQHELVMMEKRIHLAQIQAQAANGHGGGDGQ